MKRAIGILTLAIAISAGTVHSDSILRGQQPSKPSEIEQQSIQPLTLRVLELGTDSKSGRQFVELKLQNDGLQVMSYLAYPPDVSGTPLAKDIVRPYLYWEVKNGANWEPFGPIAGSEGTKAHELPARSSVVLRSVVTLTGERKHWRFGITLWKAGDVTGDKVSIWSDEVEHKGAASEAH